MHSLTTRLMLYTLARHAHAHVRKHVLTQQTNARVEHVLTVNAFLLRARPLLATVTRVRDDENDIFFYLKRGRVIVFSTLLQARMINVDR